MCSAKREIAEQFVSVLPHANLLGMRLSDLRSEYVELTMPYSDELIGDPLTGVIHGGAVFALMDTCAGLAVILHDCNPTSTATINLRMDYMRPATPGQSIRAQAECYHVTRSVAFVRARTLDDDNDRPVATATGTFTIARA